MVLNYKKYLLLLEKNNLVKDYIKDNNITELAVDKIKLLLKSNPNLIYNFLKYYNEDNIMIGGDIYSPIAYNRNLSNMLKYIQNNKQQLKNYLPKDLIKYDKFEDLVDDIGRIQFKVKVKKEFIDELPSNIRSQAKIKNLSKEDIDVLNKFIKIEKKLFTPAEKFNKFSVYLEHIKDVLSDLTGSVDGGMMNELRSWDDKDDVDLIWDVDKVLVFRVINPMFIKKYGSQNWCIVNDMTTYFSDYINPRSDNTQYIIFNFNYTPDDRYHKFGITVDYDGETLDGACQDNFNDPVDFDELLELNNIDDIIEPYQYDNDIMDMFDEMSEYTKGNSKLTEEIFLKYKEYFILDDEAFLNVLSDEKMFKLFVDNGAVINTEIATGIINSEENHHLLKYIDKDNYDFSWIGDNYVHYATVEKFIDKDFVEFFGENILMRATIGGVYDIVSILIENGINVNFGETTTPLTNAVRGNQLRIVELLLENGADVNTGFPLEYAIRDATESYTDMLELLLKYKPKLIDSSTSKRSALSYALAPTKTKADYSVVKLLIDADSDINRIEPSNGFSLLHYAIFSKNTKIVKLLIDKGSKINGGGIKLSDGISSQAFEFSLEKGTDDITRLLMDTGKVNLDNYLNIYLSALKHEKVLAAMYVINNTPSNKRDLGLLLYYTVIYNNLDVIRTLINKGANVNYQNEVGNNLLVTCITNDVHNSHFDIFNHLLNNGADINLKNEANNDAMFFAENDKKEMYIKALKILKNKE